jgi:hypothetical protein
MVLYLYDEKQLVCLISSNQMGYKRFTVSAGTGKSKETKIFTKIYIMRACIYAKLLIESK